MPLPWFLDEDAQRKKAKKKALEDKLSLSVARRGAFDEDDDFTPAPTRAFLTDKWHTLSPSEQELVRSQRARRGIRCEVCGTVGYYREMCPNGCIAEGLETPDSLNLTPPPSPPSSRTGRQPSPSLSARQPVGLGVLWGDTGFSGVGLSALGVDKDNRPTETHGNKKPTLAKRPADFSSMRHDSTERLAELQATDRPLHSFEFFTRAEEGYSRSLPELTLHQILRNIMRIVDRDVQANIRNLEAAVDTTLLHPPKDAPQVTGGCRLFFWLHKSTHRACRSLYFSVHAQAYCCSIGTRAQSPH